MNRLIILCLLALTGCHQEKLYESRIFSLGTLIDVTLYAESPARAEQAMDIIRSELNRINKTWHAWQPGVLSEINRQLETGQPFSVEPSVLAVIQQAQQLSAQSNQLFNPAIGKLIATWGFHQDDPGQVKPPAPATIKALIAANPTMQDLHINGQQLQSDNPTVKLDFGGFVKGYGLGKIAEKLKAQGIARFILNAGGDLVVEGSHPNRPWRIAIRSPDNKNALASLEAKSGEGIFTSGDYERFYMEGEKRRHHIIDPRTGYPAEGTRAVTVIHSDPGLADAAATALFIAGPNEWQEIAGKMQLDMVLLLDTENTLHMTAEMAERLTLPDHHSYQIKPSPSQK